jgi:hypothetical protein
MQQRMRTIRGVANVIPWFRVKVIFVMLKLQVMEYKDRCGELTKGRDLDIDDERKKVVYEYLDKLAGRRSIRHNEADLHTHALGRKPKRLRVAEHSFAEHATRVCEE